MLWWKFKSLPLSPNNLHYWYAGRHASITSIGKIKVKDIPIIQEQNVQDKYVEIFSFSSISLYLREKNSKESKEPFHQISSKMENPFHLTR
jgi:hypothetical protein